VLVALVLAAFVVGGGAVHAAAVGAGAVRAGSVNGGMILDSRRRQIWVIASCCNIVSVAVRRREE